MLLATLLTVATEEGPPPLIDVDGTLLIQFALFLIMLLILSRALFRPYLKLRDARHKGIEGARQEAHGMDDRVHGIIADYDAKLSAAKLRGNEERQRLRTEGAAHERQVLGRARDEAQRALEGARGKISSEANAARTKLEAESTSLAGEIVKKILGREVA
jgi:F-type H+-transporting ATPase subunit b